MDNSQTVDELIDILSLKVFLRIRSTFSFPGFATPEGRRWHIEIDHVTYRGECEKKFEGDSLIKLLRLAWIEVVKFEWEKAEQVSEL